MLDDLKQLVLKHWGHPTFRPLQEVAMRAVLDARDSLLVLPTGGGKSLCYQAPALVRGDTTVVISPLIALMKDQVNGLKPCGSANTRLNSTQSTGEQRTVEKALVEGSLRLVFASPER